MGGEVGSRTQFNNRGGTTPFLFGERKAIADRCHITARGGIVQGDVRAHVESKSHIFIEGREKANT